VKALTLARRGGRLRDSGEVSGVPVLVLQPDGMKVAGQATTLDEAVEFMAAHIDEAAKAAGDTGKALRVGIGSGAADEIAGALRARVTPMSHVSEVIDYTVGPSMGAHLGPGNAGAVFVARPV
jgi:fatty acid-binding protein DegV